MAARGSDTDARRARLRRALEGVAKDDRAALGTVYEMTSAKLLGIIMAILPDRERAEEVLQEVYIKVWRRARSYDPSMGSPISWLAIVARNAAIDEARRRGRPESGADDGAIERVADETPAIDDLLCEDQEHEAVRHCIDTLETDQRRSIMLAFFGGLSHSQLADRIGVPLGTLKSRIRRGLRNLRRCLGDERA